MYNANQNEQDILKFWQEDNTFEKSVNERPEGKPYVFYDGPPFATGLPHYGHILSSVIKDVVPRYWTMKGYRVRRRWGWDCHGLPIENLVEKELKISGKKQIEELGVDKFNNTCRSKVLTYTHEWKKMIDRIGRWVEFDNAYKTMDQTYMESVWWSLKNTWDKGLIYEGRKVLMYCPHCETPVSKAEIAMDNSYKDITEEAAIVKFKIKEQGIRSKEQFKNVDGPAYILAWTTTPWTLPGNVALAVGESIQYSVVSIEGEKGIYIIAKERLAAVLGDKKFTIINEILGSALVGLEYEPLFDISAIRETNKKAWYVTTADFVTTADGTGVVHTAVVYGEDDYNLGLKIGLPVVPLLDEKGHFNELAPELIRGQYFKKAEKVIKDDLEVRGLMFKKENFTHSYPHCWRCDTQLFYNAISAWFINIQKIKERLLKLNKKINWVPEHLKEGRFLNILETAPDWNISRNRYWATPLPFWKCNNVRTTKTTKNTKGEDCGNVVCVGSIDELREKGDRKITKIIFVRHGESKTNINDTTSCDLDHEWSLTENGKKMAEKMAKDFSEKVDVILCSPILRACETAEILNKKLKVDIIKDDALLERNFGVWNNLSGEQRKEKSDNQYYESLPWESEERFAYRPEDGESYNDVLNRVGEFVERINKEYSGKTVVVVSHAIVCAALTKLLKKVSNSEFVQIDHHLPYATPNYFYIDENGEELDLHKHNIDKIKLTCDKCGEKMTRISEVIDCWVESGSMPFAEFHYPFENVEIFKGRFPGQYIAEYIAQTRAWFYYMHVMATLLFDNVSFANVVCTGTILNEKGEKLSKSKMNYTDPWKIIEQYGVDALRYYLMTSVVMQADDLYFSDGGVKEVYNKVINILWNVVEFYKMYTSESYKVESYKVIKSENVLDGWILAKLNLLVKEVTENMDKYDTVRAGRPIKDFIDDLSTWYVRRSRDRFKGEDVEDKNSALATLHLVLSTLSKLMAPFMPFIAEQIHQGLRSKEKGVSESIHLASWPEVDEKMIDEKVLKDMGQVRKIVEMGLALRAEAGVKVRQPLNELRIMNNELSSELRKIVAEELNVKDVVIVENVQAVENVVVKEDGDLKVGLDTTITPELKKGGLVREIVRTINQIRKEQKLTIHDKVKVEYQTEDKVLGEVFVEYAEEIKKGVLASNIVETGQVTSLETEIDGVKVGLKVIKE